MIKARLSWGVVVPIAMAVLSALLAASPPALSADNAEMLIRRGVELRRKGRDKDAVQYFRQAYELSRTPRSAAQLGLCELALEQNIEAEQHLSESLVAESDPWIAGKRSTIVQARLSVRTKLTSLMVEGLPKGALIVINDRVLGQMPLAEEAWLAPGSHVVVVRKDGFQTREVPVHLNAGQAKTLSVELAEQQVTRSSRLASTDSTPIEAAANDVALNPPGSASRRRSWQSYASWGAFGLSGLSLAVGIVGHVNRESGISDFNSGALSCGKKDGMVVGGAACTTLDADIARSTSQMTIGYLGAVVFAGVAIGLRLAVPTVTDASLACGMVPALDLQNLGRDLRLQCGGTF